MDVSGSVLLWNRTFYLECCSLTFTDWVFHYFSIHVFDVYVLMFCTSHCFMCVCHMSLKDLLTYLVIFTYLLSSPPIWPHHGRAHQPTLAKSVGKDRVQGRSADLPGTARWCSSVPTAVYTSRRHPDPTKTPVFHLGRSVCSCCQTGYCWTSWFLCRWRSCVERPSCRCHFSTFFAHFPKTFKIASLHFPILTLSSKFIFLSLRGPCGSCLLRVPVLRTP